MSQPDRFLLYIDILGFSEMTETDPVKVTRLYSILDSLVVHKNKFYKTIVFSDTILVYNIEKSTNYRESEQHVWYLTEFAEDLQQQLTGQGIYFRAVLTAGDFNHYRLSNIECFYGGALIKAYFAEKNIPSLGMFMDETCREFNRFFRVERFDRTLSFVYLTRAIVSLLDGMGGDPDLPISNEGFDLSDLAPKLPWDLRFMQDLYRNMRSHSVPAVRTKFLTAWDFYERRYPKLMARLVAHDFDVDSISTVPGQWKNEIDDLRRQIHAASIIRTLDVLKLVLQYGKTET